MIIIYNFNILYYIKIKTNSKKMVKLFCYEKKRKIINIHQQFYSGKRFLSSQMLLLDLKIDTFSLN